MTPRIPVVPAFPQGRPWGFGNTQAQILGVVTAKWLALARTSLDVLIAPVFVAATWRIVLPPDDDSTRGSQTEKPLVNRLMRRRTVSSVSLLCEARGTSDGQTRHARIMPSEKNLVNSMI